MPSGYTSNLYDGLPQTFEEFVLDCARAFAWWHHDSSASSLQDAPEQDYAQRSLEQHREKLHSLLAQSPEQYRAEHAEEVARIVQGNIDRAEKNRKLKGRYEAMLQEVREWKPPTEKHEGLKNFMIEQLENSIEHDCGEWNQQITFDAEEWQRERIEHTQKMIEKYKEDAKKEKERNEQNRAWVFALFNSLENKKGGTQ